MHGAAYDALPGRGDDHLGLYRRAEGKPPSYKEVSGGNTGHIEAVQIAYDPAKIVTSSLLKVYWRATDPLDGGGQFCDRGSRVHKLAIFYQNEETRKTRGTVKEFGREATRSSGGDRNPPGHPFYAAEDYHQNYYLKNPVRYKYYRYSCGRDQRLEKLWGKLKPTRTASGAKLRR